MDCYRCPLQWLRVKIGVRVCGCKGVWRCVRVGGAGEGKSGDSYSYLVQVLGRSVPCDLATGEPRRLRGLGEVGDSLRSVDTLASLNTGSGSGSWLGSGLRSGSR